MCQYQKGRRFDIPVEELPSNGLELCECCGRYMENVVVDHNRKTGQVRGIICRRCNTALGMLGDDIEGLTKFMMYLSRSEIMRE